MRRVAVTGYGTISSLGENSSEIWQAILAGRPGCKYQGDRGEAAAGVPRSKVAGGGPAHHLNRALDPGGGASRRLENGIRNWAGGRDGKGGDFPRDPPGPVGH